MYVERLVHDKNFRKNLSIQTKKIKKIKKIKIIIEKFKKLCLLIFLLLIVSTITSYFLIIFCSVL